MAIRQLTRDELGKIEKQLTDDSGQRVSVDRDDILSLLNEVVYRRERDGGSGVLTVESLVSMRDQQGYVRVNLGDKNVQLSLKEAEQHARFLLEAVSAARSDAFINRFARETLGQSADVAMRMLAQFRAMRQQEAPAIAVEDVMAPMGGTSKN